MSWRLHWFEFLKLKLKLEISILLLSYNSSRFRLYFCMRKIAAILETASSIFILRSKFVIVLIGISFWVILSASHVTFRTGEKSFPELKFTNIYYTICCHYATLIWCRLPNKIPWRRFSVHGAADNTRILSQSSLSYIFLTWLTQLLIRLVMVWLSALVQVMVCCRFE